MDVLVAHGRYSNAEGWAIAHLNLPQRRQRKPRVLQQRREGEHMVLIQLPLLPEFQFLGGVLSRIARRAEPTLVAVNNVDGCEGLPLEFPFECIFDSVRL